MNLYLISQSVNTSYDTYDAAAIVRAPSEELARRTHPSGSQTNVWSKKLWWNDPPNDWAPLGSIEVTLIGVAPPDSEAGVVLASFNAG